MLREGRERGRENRRKGERREGEVQREGREWTQRIKEVTVCIWREGGKEGGREAK